MKLVTLLVPAYQPRPYEGATPTPYQSGTVDAFENALVLLSPLVVRQPNGVRLYPDGGRWVKQEIVTPYQLLVEPEDTVLGDVILLVLKTFKLGSVTVVNGDDAEPFTTTEAEELQAGLHAWNV